MRVPLILALPSHEHEADDRNEHDKEENRDEHDREELDGVQLQGRGCNNTRELSLIPATVFIKKLK